MTFLSPVQMTFRAPVAAVASVVASVGTSVCWDLNFLLLQITQDLPCSFVGPQSSPSPHSGDELSVAGRETERERANSLYLSLSVVVGSAPLSLSPSHLDCECHEPCPCSARAPCPCKTQPAASSTPWLAQWLRAP